MGRLGHSLPSSSFGGIEPVDKHILVALLRACGGSIALDGSAFIEDLSKVHIERLDMQDPWRIVIKMEEPE